MGTYMKITNKYNLPEAMVRALQSDYEYKDKRYSVTTLLNPIRETHLKRRYHEELEVDASDMIWALWGTGIHKALEGTAVDGELLEQGLGYNVYKDYKLTGYADLIDVKNKKVVDYKSTSVWQYIKGDHTNYKLQLQMYAYLYYKMTGLWCDTGEIVMFMRDFSKMRAKVENDYPERPVATLTFDLETPDVIETWVYDRMALLAKYEAAKDNELPLCTPEERYNDGDTYAIMKKGKKRAIKLHKDLEEAETHLFNLSEYDPSGTYYIEERQGTDLKCLEYCNVNKYCDYYKTKYQD